MPDYPQLRLHRLRRTEALRAFVRENHVDIGDMVYPIFVVGGKGVKQEIASMPGIFHLSTDKLLEEVEEVEDGEAGFPTTAVVIAVVAAAVVIALLLILRRRAKA